MRLDSRVNDFLGVCALERQRSPHTLQAYRSDLADFQRWVQRNDGIADSEMLRLYLEDMVKRRALSVRRRVACLR